MYEILFSIHSSFEEWIILISFSNSAWRELSNDTPLGKIQAILNFGLNHLKDLADLVDDIVEVIEVNVIGEVVEVGVEAAN